MPTIISATDFSEVATHAVHYACGLAKDFGSDLHLVHSFMIPVTFHETPMPVIPVDEGRRAAEEAMQTLLDELVDTYPGLNISGRVSFGDLMDTMEEIHQELAPLMVVVGNSSDNETPFWLGSNLITAMRQLPLHVLAVPTGQAYRRVHHICMAWDLAEDPEKFPVSALQEIIRYTEATLEILSIGPKEFGKEENREALLAALNPIKPDLFVLDSLDVEEGVFSHLSQGSSAGKKPDWLLVAPQKYGFFQGLWHKSHTKALVRTCPIPMMAIHKSSPKT